MQQQVSCNQSIPIVCTRTCSLQTVTFDGIEFPFLKVPKLTREVISEEALKALPRTTCKDWSTGSSADSDTAL